MLIFDKNWQRCWYLFAEEVAGNDGVTVAGHQLGLAFCAREALDVVDAGSARQRASSSAAYRMPVTLLGAAAAAAAAAARPARPARAARAATWRLIVGARPDRSDPHHQLVGRDPLAAGRTRPGTSK